MEMKFVKFLKEEHIATITLDRPEALNALNPELLSELETTLDNIAEDKDIYVVVLTGAGRSFIAGADITKMPDFDARTALKYAQLGHRVTAKISALHCPVIAAVNGFALGGGTEVAISCDLIYASEKARFGQPEVHLGIMPGFGGTQRLPRLIGPGRAKELIYTGEHITAQKAKEIGLALEVYPPEELMKKVMERARLIAAQGPVAVSMCKSAINSGYNMDIAGANELERQTFAALFSTEDAKEGPKAFIEKRNPDFKGK